MIKFHEDIIDSGIPWIGKIPKHWKILRVKDVFLNLDYKRIPLSGAVREKMQNKEYDYYGASGIIDKVEDYIFDDKVILIGEDGANLLTRTKPLAFIVEGKFWVNNHAHILKTKKGFNPHYFVNVLESLNYSIWVSGSAQPKLTQDKLNNITIFVPPKEEQTLIANYLDQKTSIIDKKIELLQQKIDYYEELQKSLINETVTKGLNKEVKLKDSGIDWIGEIPEHWEVKRMKDFGYLYSGLSGKKGDDFGQEEHERNRNYIPFTTIAKSLIIDHDELKQVIVGEKENQNSVRQNDIFFLMSSEGYEDLGKASLLLEDLEETYLNSFCKGFRVKPDKIEPKFLNYLLSSTSYRTCIMIEGKGFTRINLKMAKINDLLVFLPPIEGQKKLVRYLDDKTFKIMTITSNINKQIGLLRELRKTLINDVVTGKIRVNEAIETD